MEQAIEILFQAGFWAAALRIGLEELDRSPAGLARDLEDIVGRPEPGVLTGTHIHGVGLPSACAARPPSI